MVNINNIILKLVNYYKQIYGNSLRHVYLYGSYARGDHQTDSDIDIVAIVDGNREYLQEQLKKVWDYATDLELEYDVIISPTVIPTTEFIAFKTTLPYYTNIAKEGIEFYV